MTPPPILEIDNLAVSFDQDFTRPVLHGVSLSVAEGEVLALVGESGSGKSMTAMSVMRLLPAGAAMRADRMTVAGTEITQVTERQMNTQRGSTVSMLFQQPKRMLDPTVQVGHQVAEPLRRHRGLSRGAARAQVLELLRDVGVDDPERRARAYPHQLSGGLAQRIMIACALAAQPRLLIADEPTTALDVSVEAQILRLLARKKRENGLSVLFISHDLGVVASIADRIAVMYAGRIVEQGPTQEILNAPSHPYTRALIQCSLLRPDDTGELYVIPGGPSSAREMSAGCRFRPRCKVSAQAGVDHLCTSREPELAAAADPSGGHGHGHGDGHDSRCWATANAALKETA